MRMLYYLLLHTGGRRARFQVACSHAVAAHIDSDGIPHPTAISMCGRPYPQSAYLESFEPTPIVAKIVDKVTCKLCKARIKNVQETI